MRVRLNLIDISKIKPNCSWAIALLPSLNLGYDREDFNEGLYYMELVWLTFCLELTLRK